MPYLTVPPDIAYVVAGLIVGAAVGLTGVGGGTLMTPILVLIFRIAPATAVGTDLWFSAVTKVIGGVAHIRHGTVDWQVVGRVCIGSIPAAVVMLMWMHRTQVVKTDQGLLVHVLGCVLLLATLATLLRGRVRTVALQLGARSADRITRMQPGLTMLAGVVLGVMVSLTSVGAGALGSAMLLSLYPHRLSSSRLTGTDIAHAVPLALVAGSGHLMLGDVQWSLFADLLVGSIPGVIIGSLASSRSPETLVRAVMTVSLFGVSVRLILS